jgi:hypothetical protein
MTEERKPSRWERMRLNLVVPIGVVVAVAVICVVVAVLTSAHRADEVSLDREQQLVQRAIAARGERILREVESVAATDRATLAIRTDYDPQWVERSIGAWLPTFFDHDVVVVVDGSDQIKYKFFRSPGDPAGTDLRAQLAPSLDLLRGRLAAMPSRTIAVLAQNPRKPGRRTALIQQFAGRRLSSRRWRSAPRPISRSATTGRPSCFPSNISTRTCCARSATGCSCRACARSTIRPRPTGSRSRTSPTRRGTP